MRKMSLILIVAVVLGAFLATQSFAAQQEKMGQQAAMQESSRMSHMMGKTMKDQQGQKLGTIDDLVVDQNGRVSYIIVSGSEIGKANQLIPIPWNAANPRLEKGEVIVRVSKSKLQNAPNFEKNNWSKLEEPGMDRRVNAYYGIEAVEPGMP